MQGCTFHYLHVSFVTLGFTLGGAVHDRSQRGTERRNQKHALGAAL